MGTSIVRTCLWLALSAASTVLLPRATHADDGDPADYNEAVNLGVAEFEDKNFVEARAHFARAHARSPNARTARALGMVAFELKKYIESVSYLKEALASRERPLEGEKRLEAQQLLARANGFLARLTLEVSPEAATVTVDGLPVTLAEGGLLVLEAGDHVLELKASGFISDRRKLEIRGGERERLQVALVAMSSASRQDVERGESRRPVYKSPWLWTALGVVVVGAAAGTAIALTRDGTSGKGNAYLGMSGAPAVTGP